MKNCQQLFKKAVPVLTVVIAMTLTVPALAGDLTGVTGTRTDLRIDPGIISGLGNGAFASNEAVSGTQAANKRGLSSGYDMPDDTSSGWAARVDVAPDNAGLKNKPSLLPSQVVETYVWPTGLAVMPDGTFLVTDAYTRSVYRLYDGELTPFAGSGASESNRFQPPGGYVDGAAAESFFRTPWAIAPFLGGWAVTDAENNAVRLILDGAVQTINPVAGGNYFSYLVADRNKLSYPTGLAAGKDGNLYVSDTHKGRVCRISSKGKLTVEVQGLKDPMGLCWRDGVLYIAETGANRIVELKNGKTSVVAGSGTEGYRNGSGRSAQFSAPQAVTVGEDGTLYVSDTGNSAIRRIASGQVTTIVRREPTNDEDLSLVCPAGMVVYAGQLYVCDSFTGQILAYSLKEIMDS